MLVMKTLNRFSKSKVWELIEILEKPFYHSAQVCFRKSIIKLLPDDYWEEDHIWVLLQHIKQARIEKIEQNQTIPDGFEDVGF